MSKVIYRTERGLNQSVQLSLVLPVLLLAVLGTIQGALWMHASVVAHRAAFAGSDIARTLSGTDHDAHLAVQRILSNQGINSEVDIHRSPTEVTVEVTAYVHSIIGTDALEVTATSSAPRERQ